MSHYSIRSKTSILFQGNYKSLSACIEDAVRQGIKLASADLRYQNLCQADLDNADLKGADFTGANLMSANLSESDLTDAVFDDAMLYGTCFAYSILKNCSFHFALFGGTDLLGANLNLSSFKGQSWRTLDLFTAAKMQDCVFEEPDGQIRITSEPPVIISGLSPQKIALFNIIPALSS